MQKNTAAAAILAVAIVGCQSKKLSPNNELTGLSRGQNSHLVKSIVSEHNEAVAEFAERYKDAPLPCGLTLQQLGVSIVQTRGELFGTEHYSFLAVTTPDTTPVANPVTITDSLNRNFVPPSTDRAAPIGPLVLKGLNETDRDTVKKSLQTAQQSNGVGYYSDTAAKFGAAAEKEYFNRLVDHPAASKLYSEYMKSVDPKVNPFANRVLPDSNIHLNEIGVELSLATATLSVNSPVEGSQTLKHPKVVIATLSSGAIVIITDQFAEEMRRFTNSTELIQAIHAEAVRQNLQQYVSINLAREALPN